MDYFLLNAKTGELHTARPLDREALSDATGIIVLTVRVCELEKLHSYPFDTSKLNHFHFP